MHCRLRTVCPLLQSGLVLANSLDPYLHTRSPYRLVKALLVEAAMTVLSVDCLKFGTQRVFNDFSEL